MGIAAGPEATAAMFAVALGGLAVGLVVHGRLAPSVLRQTASVVRPLLIPLGLAIVATLTATAALSLRVTQAVSLVAPFVVCLLGLGYGGRLSLTAGPAHDATKALPECGGSLRDLTVFAVGFALARALTDSGVFQAVTDAVVSLQIASCIPAILVLLAVVLAFLGVPAMVCAGLVAAASSLLMGDSPPINRLVLASYAWSSASMLSVTSGTLTIVASSFGVPLRPLVLGLNLLAIAVFGLPSMTENFGIAVAEAAASGVALLISERVNIAPAFKRDDAAVVVAPELGPATQGLRLLLAHPDRARAMALRAERVVRQRFTWNAVADGLLSMYRQVPDAPEDAWTAASHGVVADAKAGTGPALHAALTKR